VHDVQIGCECVSYVREGRVAYQGPGDKAGDLLAGEFQVMTLSSEGPSAVEEKSFGVRARVFQLLLCSPSNESSILDEKEHISVAQRRDELLLVASQSGRRGGLAIHSPVDIYSTVLRRGGHVSRAVPRRATAWVHVIDGEVRIDDTTLRMGDSVGLVETELLSLTATEDSEILVAEFGREGDAQAASEPRK
jgi:redox-sensitive bicupin YhaK (pirin superfamily)